MHKLTCLTFYSSSPGASCSHPYNSNFFIKEIKTAFSDIKEDISEKEIKRVSDSIILISNYRSDLKEVCFIHGDFHHGNTIIKKGDILGFIDLDWCRVGNPLEDLAYAAMMLLRDFSKEFRFDETYLSNILKWYGLEPKKNNYS